jgi:hypothetical protein
MVDAKRAVAEILGLYIDLIDGSVSDAQSKQTGLFPHNLQSACQSGAAKVREEFFHIRGNRRLEGHGLSLHRMLESEAPCMECLTFERDRSELVRPERVADLADQRMTAKARLYADLIALTSSEAHLNEARRLE